METLNNNQQTIGLQFFSDEDINANIRMLMIDESPWFVGRDIALSLGYNDPVSAITQHVDNERLSQNKLEIASFFCFISN